MPPLAESILKNGSHPRPILFRDPRAIVGHIDDRFAGGLGKANIGLAAEFDRILAEVGHRTHQGKRLELRNKPCRTVIGHVVPHIGKLVADSLQDGGQIGALGCLARMVVAQITEALFQKTVDTHDIGQQRIADLFLVQARSRSRVNGVRSSWLMPRSMRVQWICPVRVILLTNSETYKLGNTVGLCHCALTDADNTNERLVDRIRGKISAPINQQLAGPRNFSLLISLRSAWIDYGDASHQSPLIMPPSTRIADPVT